MSVPISGLSDFLHRLSKSIPNKILSDLNRSSPIWTVTDPPKDAIKTALRLAHFLGQCAYESNLFKSQYENLNYSTHRLLHLFPKYFSDADTTQEYAHCEEKIASRIYARRMGNGDEASGDGFRFRGRGYLQLTGRDNYALFSSWIGYNCIDDPDAVANRYSLMSGIFFFHHTNLWPLCEQGIDHDTIATVTQTINGGYHGLKKRMIYVQKFFNQMHPKNPS